VKKPKKKPDQEQQQGEERRWRLASNGSDSGAPAATEAMDMEQRALFWKSSMEINKQNQREKETTA